MSIIRVTGSVRRSFIFPADIATACTYYKDVQRIFAYLPHISLVKVYGQHQYRLLYNTVELKVYRVRIYCDLEAWFDAEKKVLHFRPFSDHPPVKPDATVNSLSAQGSYTSESSFHDEGSHTRIEYLLKLHATLPKPLGLNLIPDSVVEQIAKNITMWRIHEIADGFIERSIKEFRRERERGRFLNTD